jgi:hypothetical protein
VFSVVNFFFTFSNLELLDVPERLGDMSERLGDMSVFLSQRHRAHKGHGGKRGVGVSLCTL